MGPPTPSAEMLRALMAGLEAEHTRLLAELEELRGSDGLRVAAGPEAPPCSVDEGEKLLGELDSLPSEAAATTPSRGRGGYPCSPVNRDVEMGGGGYHVPPVQLAPAPPGGAPVLLRAEMAGPLTPPGLQQREGSPPRLPQREGSPPRLPREGSRHGQQLWGIVRERLCTGGITPGGPRFRTVNTNGSLETVELNDVWRKRRMPLGRPAVHRATAHSMGSSSSPPLRGRNIGSSGLKRSTHHIPSGDEEDRRGCDEWLQPLILKPDDRRHLLWDVTSMLVLFIDVLGTPLDVFGMPESAWRDALELFTLIFWTLDIIFTFFSGYHTMKNVEMRPSRIAMHYFKTWFLVDLAIVIMEWVSVGGAGILRLGKFARGARVIRMLRIIKVQVLFEQLNDFIRNETSLMAFQITRLVIFILAINHFVACGWWAVGTAPEDVSSHWTDSAMRHDDGVAYAYLTCLHWALTQFTPASMEVVPTNVWERLYTILVLMMGLGAFSSFVASISTLMTQLRTLRSQQQKEDMQIRRYLLEHGISLELGNRILYFFRENRRAVRRKRLVERDVKALDVLPDSLKIQLHWEVYQPAILPHPLFYSLDTHDHSGIVEVCHRSMSERIMGQGQELFHYGQEAEHMYFVARGQMDYLPGKTLADTTGGEIHDVDEGTWVSEMVLWMKWIHHGSIRARCNCDLVELNANKFHEHVRHRPICFETCRHYARLYVGKVAEICRDTQELPEDVWGTIDDLRTLVHHTSDHLGKNTRPFAGVVNMMLNIFADVRDRGSERRASDASSRVGGFLARSKTPPRVVPLKMT